MIIFYPFSLLYGFFVYLREKLYEIGIFPSYKPKSRIVSVGNITFGGTGKTPTVDFLVEHLTGKKIAILSRGYGRATTGFYKVNAEQANAATLYGDEPVQLARKHPNVPVYVCEDRVLGCEMIEKEFLPELILADDAFQHLKLKKNKDIVVIDATEKFENYHYPPVGRARNSFRYLKRADYIFLTKTNLCSVDQLDHIRKMLERHNVFEFESRIEGIYDLRSDQKVETQIKDVYLVSGIGKPETFETLLKKNYPEIHIQEHFTFKDHHDYSQGDIEKIKTKVNGGIVLTTEKDAVKLRKFSDDLHLSVAKLEFVNRRNMEKIIDEILH